MSTEHRTTHRRLAEIIVIEGESRDRFLTLAASLYDEFQPRTIFEESLIGEMIAAFWRRMRIWNMETAGMDHEIRRQAESPNSVEGPATRASLAFRALADNSRSLDLMNRCDSRYERDYLRAHRRFLEVRDDRKPAPNAAPAPDPAASLPVPQESEAPISASPESDSAERTQQVTENTANSPDRLDWPNTFAISKTIVGEAHAR
jgi:hypothetical protein